MLDDLKSRSGCSTEADNVGGEQASEEKVCSCFCSRKNYMPGPFSKKPGDKIPRRIFKKLLYRVGCTTKKSALPQQRMSGTANKYGMALPPFSSWIQKQQIKTPEADRILPLIAAAPDGISRGEIGRAIKLDRQVLDEFLDGLVRVGMVQMTDQNGIRTYRTAGAI